jgi:hypothetical protein
VKKQNKFRHLFKADEWVLFLKLGGGMTDPEEKRAFFETILEKKHVSSRYSLFDDFPRDQTEGKRIAGEILAQVAEINAKKQKETKTFLPERNGELAEWGKMFGEVLDRELAKKAEAK